MEFSVNFSKMNYVYDYLTNMTISFVNFSVRNWWKLINKILLNDIFWV